jgi:central glycolytic genes regulator
LRWIDVQKKLVPDVLEIIGRRFRVLQVIRSAQPIGRRSLAQLVGMTERVLRRETDFLKNQGLLSFSASGIQVTTEGEHLLPEMEGLIREWLGLTDLERQLRQKTGLQKVIIVPGDSQTSPWIQHDLGRAAVEQLQLLAEKDCVVAVAGGTTMAAVAEAMAFHPLLKTLQYVPARGGLGEDVENQANTICSKMAAKSGGDYRLLHVPDQLSKEAHDSLLDDEHIRDIVQVIRSARIVIHGIGDAMTMARRRNASTGFLHILEQEKAVGEAFGYYLDQSGQVIHKIQTIGLRLEDVENARHILAVAGGKDKAKAILAFLSYGVHDVLITDEGAARAMLETVDS